MPEPGSLPESEREKLRAELADRYTIQEEVGAGGMGIVFRAHDVRHDRQVALKVLRPEIAASVGKDRFLREVRIEAGLNHPHILPVFDSGEVGGLLYCVTPFVDGESLSDRLKREKQLPCTDAIRICREIADALMFAHARDVIHRDVKPGNILLESGHAILADFGLAKAISESGDTALTRTGFSVGTPAYTSPEQASGEGEIDGRADLYSLGCVLYEMLAGQPPFLGPTSDSVVRQHFTAEPTAVRILRPGVDEATEDILFRLLEKSPADRFSSAEELVRALDAVISGEFPRVRRPGQRRRHRISWPPRIAGAAVLVLVLGGIWAINRRGELNGSGPVESGFSPTDLAVLYFDDLGPKADLQYVADGLTENLIDELSRVGDLHVVSRGGVAPFRDSSAPLDSIAAVLEVGTLIKGSIEPVGDRLRVSIRLVDGGSGSDFDRRSFDVPSSEFLLAQDSVIEESVWLLRERLGEEVRLRRRRAETSSVEAWSLVQQAERARKEAEDLLPRDDLDGAMAAYGRADSLLGLAESADPNWIEPVQMRGWIAYRQSRQAPDFQGRMEAIHRALSHADRALAMDPNHPRALELRGTVLYWRWWQQDITDPEEHHNLLVQAQEDLENATRIDHSLASAYATLSHLYYQTADLTSALVAARAAYEADVFLTDGAVVLKRMVNASYDLGQFTQARWACDQGHERFPKDYFFWRCQIMTMALPNGNPDPEEAWRLYREAVALTPEAPRPLEERVGQMFVADVLARSGLPDSANAVLVRARAGPEIDPYGSLAFLEAHVRTVLGEDDEAISLLHSLYAGFAESGGDAGDWANHWYWNDLRDNPDFQKLIHAPH